MGAAMASAPSPPPVLPRAGGRSIRRRAPFAVLALALVASSCYSYTSPDLTVTFPEQLQTSSVYDNDGVLLTELEAAQNRTNVRFDEIPQVMIDAIVAIEDERFYLHHGFDLRGLIRSARTNVSAGGVEQGGSTITQQLVKLTQQDQLTECFDDEGNPTRTIQCEIQEVNLARRLEQQYTKEFILEQYLNVVFFGNNAYGVQAAAEEYFQKDIGEITLAEAALLAGLVQRPSGFDPYDFPDDAERRRRLVLDRMLANEFISQAEHDEAYDLTVRTIVQAEDAGQETAAYEEVFPGAHFVDEVRRWFLDGDDPQIVELFPTEEERENALYGGGLRIYTTLDRNLQERAQEIVYGANGILPNPDGPDGAAVVMEPATGNVLAMVAGRDYFGEEVHTNLAVAGEDNDGDGDPDGGRQAGSSMKPIALAYTLERGGFEVTDTYAAPSNIEFRPSDYPAGTLTTPWRVKGGGGGGRVTLVTATRQSYNTVYAQLMLDIGAENFVDMAYDLGVNQETSPISPVPAAVLGTEDVTVMDLATVYGTFANNGDRVDPSYVSRIVAADGTVIYEHIPERVPVLAADTAAQISWVLRGVIEEGTAERNGQIGRPAAGKTGTAQNLADATFAGYVPQLVTAVWVGFPQGQIPMRPPRTAIDVFGGTYPTQIWREIMLYALGPEGLDYDSTEFPTPPTSTTTTSTTILSEQPLAAVPNVRGLSEADARATLEAAGFAVESVPAEVEGGTPGTVSAQAPAGDVQTYLGTVVTIEIVTTPPPPSSPVTVPSVVGLTLAEARQVLIGAGFAISEENIRQPGTPPGSAVGIVWEQSPVAGSPPPSTASITVRVNPP